MADTTPRRGGAHNSVEARVTADQHTILGDGTTEHPLHVDMGVVAGGGPGGSGGGGGGSIAAATDGVTVLGDGTSGDRLHTNPDGVPVATDGTTILGRGTKDSPLHAPGGSGSPPSALPMTLHGAAFQVSKPGQIADPGVALGLNGLFIPGPSGTVLVMASVSLPPGTHVTTVTVRVIDGLSTQVEAHFGSINGPVHVSDLSPGDGQQHDLVVHVDATIEAGEAYFVDAINPNGNTGWAVEKATIA